MTKEREKPTKPLGRPAYGSIPHLIGSRRGPADSGVNEGQQRICCERLRSARDEVIVLAKLDGSNVAVAKRGGQLLALTRAGYLAVDSPYSQHHLFAAWVDAHAERFREVLFDGEHISGEWLAQAHGTRYDLARREPFVAFDLWTGSGAVPFRVTWQMLEIRVRDVFALAPVLHRGGPLTTDAAMALQGAGRYGELDAPEGAVWRVETYRRGSDCREVDFLAKYVRPDKRDGAYLESVSGRPAVWNWPVPHGGAQ